MVNRVGSLLQIHKNYSRAPSLIEMKVPIISIRYKARDHRMKRSKARLLPADKFVFIEVFI